LRQWRAGTADIAVVQAVAGHASAATTLKVYTHLRDTRLKQAANLFDPAALALEEKGELT
jgi:integrase